MAWQLPTKTRTVQDGGQFLSTYFTQGGKRKQRSLAHSGLDYAAGAGEPIISIASGVIEKRSTSAKGSWGFYTYVNHIAVASLPGLSQDDFRALAKAIGRAGFRKGERIYSYYAHMQRPGLVPVGKNVKAGTVLGNVGNSGVPAVATHLHWGIAICTPAEFARDVLPAGAAMRNHIVDPEKFIAAINSINAKNAAKPVKSATPAPLPASAPAPRPPLLAAVFDSGPDARGGDSTIVFEAGSPVKAPLSEPTKDRFIFNGWAYQGKLWDFSKPVAEKMADTDGAVRFEALWSAAPEPEPVEPEPSAPVIEPLPESVKAPARKVPLGAIVGAVVAALTAALYAWLRTIG